MKRGKKLIITFLTILLFLGFITPAYAMPPPASGIWRFYIMRKYLRFYGNVYAVTLNLVSGGLRFVTGGDIISSSGTTSWSKTAGSNKPWIISNESQQAIWTNLKGGITSSVLQVKNSHDWSTIDCRNNWSTIFSDDALAWPEGKYCFVDNTGQTLNIKDKTLQDGQWGTLVVNGGNVVIDNLNCINGSAIGLILTGGGNITFKNEGGGKTVFGAFYAEGNIIFEPNTNDGTNFKAILAANTIKLPGYGNFEFNEELYSKILPGFRETFQRSIEEGAP